MDTMKYLLSASLLLGILFTFLGIIGKQENYLKERLDFVSNESNKEKKDIRYQLANMIKKIIKNKVDHKVISTLEKKINSANFNGKTTPIDTYSLQFVYLILFLIIGMMIAFIMDTDLTNTLLFGAFGGLIGFRLPVIELDTEIKRRQKRITLELPTVLNLLIVCTKSGMNFENALKKVCQKLTGVFVEELKRVLIEMDQNQSMEKAFDNLANRCDIYDIWDLSNHIKLSKKLGIPVSKNLPILSDIVAKRNFDMTRQKAAKASANIFFPVMVFILPALMIITMGPVLMKVAKM